MFAERGTILSVHGLVCRFGDNLVGVNESIRGRIFKKELGVVEYKKYQLRTCEIREMYGLG